MFLFPNDIVLSEDLVLHLFCVPYHIMLTLSFYVLLV